MANHAGSMTQESAADAAFVNDRKAMFGRFVHFVTYSVAVSVVVLALMAIFLT